MKIRFNTALFIALSFMVVTFTACLKADPAQDYSLKNELIQTDKYVKGLISNNLDVDTTASGIYYVRLKEGTGPFPQEGDTLSVQYVGYLMDNAIFDTSFYNLPDSAINYVYKKSEFIPGWESMMGLMNKGCKMEFIIPSSLAYGSKGSLRIPPYSALIFVAIMRDIRK